MRNTHPDEPHERRSTHPDEPHERRSTHPDEPHERRITHPDEPHERRSTHPDEPHERRSTHLDEPHERRSTQPDEPHERRSTHPDEPHGKRSTHPDEPHERRSTHPDEPHESRSTHPDKPHERRSTHPSRAEPEIAGNRTTLDLSAALTDNMFGRSSKTVHVYESQQKSSSDNNNQKHYYLEQSYANSARANKYNAKNLAQTAFPANSGYHFQQKSPRPSSTQLVAKTAKADQIGNPKHFSDSGHRAERMTVSLWSWQIWVNASNKLITKNFTTPFFGVAVRLLKPNSVANPADDNIFWGKKVTVADKERFLVVVESDKMEFSGECFQYAFCVSETTNFSDIGRGKVKFYSTAFTTRAVGQNEFVHDIEELPFKTIRGPHHFSAPLPTTMEPNDAYNSTLILNAPPAQSHIVSLQVFVNSKPPGIPDDQSFSVCIMTSNRNRIVVGSLLYSDDKFCLIGFPDFNSAQESKYFYFAIAGDYQIAEVNDSKDGYRTLKRQDLYSGSNLDGVIEWSGGPQPNQSPWYDPRSYFPKRSTSEDASLLKKQRGALAIEYFCTVRVMNFITRFNFDAQYAKLLKLSAASARNPATLSYLYSDSKTITNSLTKSLASVVKAMSTQKDKFGAALFVLLFLGTDRNVKSVHLDVVTAFLTSLALESEDDAQNLKNYIQSVSKYLSIDPALEACSQILTQFAVKREAPLAIEWMTIFAGKVESLFGRMRPSLSSDALVYYPTECHTSTETKLLTLYWVKDWGDPTNVLNLNLQVADYMHAINWKLKRETNEVHSSYIGNLAPHLLQKVKSIKRNEALHFLSGLSSLVSELKFRNSNTLVAQETTTSLLLFVCASIDAVAWRVPPEQLAHFLDSNFEANLVDTTKREIDKMFNKWNESEVRENSLLFCAQLISQNFDPDNHESMAYLWLSRYQGQMKKYVATKVSQEKRDGDLTHLFHQVKAKHPSRNWSQLEEILMSLNDIETIKSFLYRSSGVRQKT